MARDPRGSGGLLEDAGKLVGPTDAVRADQRGAVALARPLVEQRLVLRRRQAVERPRRGTGRALPDGGVALRSARRVAADVQQPVTLGDTRVELRLVLGGGEIVARHPGRAAA